MKKRQMQYNAKAKLATTLRKLAIPYESYGNPDLLQIGSVSIIFDASEETITFRDNRYPTIWFCTHYSHPSTLLFNLHRFNDMIKFFIGRKGCFCIPINLN